MLEDTKKIYEKTKLDKIIEDEGPAPITFVHVFHKEYPRLSKIKIPTAYLEGEFENLLQKRQSDREFSEEKLSLDELSKILYSCRIVDMQREPERRTYPSAGARFPVELYLVSFNVNGLENGVYHYNIKQFLLEQLWKKDLRANEKEIASPYLQNTAAAIIFTSVIARSEVKYGLKSYPYSLIEAGHMAQNILLACSKYDIGACPIGGFINDTVSKTLDLTEEEIPIYVIGLGKKI